MIVSCTLCGIKFKFNEALLKQNVTKVQCFKCKHVFKVYRRGAKQAGIVPRTPPPGPRAHPRVKGRLARQPEKNGPSAMSKSNAPSMESRGARRDAGGEKPDALEKFANTETPFAAKPPMEHAKSDGGTSPDAPEEGLVLGFHDLEKTRPTVEKHSTGAPMKPSPPPDDALWESKSDADDAPGMPEEEFTFDLPGLEDVKTPEESETREKNVGPAGASGFIVLTESDPELENVDPLEIPEEEFTLDLPGLEDGEASGEDETVEKTDRPEGASDFVIPTESASELGDEDSLGIPEEEFTLDLPDLENDEPATEAEAEEKTARPKSPAAPVDSAESPPESEIDEAPGASEDDFTLDFLEFKKTVLEKDDANEKNVTSESASGNGIATEGASGSVADEAPEAPDDAFTLDFLEFKKSMNLAGDEEAGENEAPDASLVDEGDAESEPESDADRTPETSGDELDLDLSDPDRSEPVEESDEAGKTEEPETRLEDGGVPESESQADAEQTPETSGDEMGPDSSEPEKSEPEEDSGEAEKTGDPETRLEEGGVRESELESDAEQTPESSGDELDLDLSEPERGDPEEDSGEAGETEDPETPLEDGGVPESESQADAEQTSETLEDALKPEPRDVEKNDES